MTEEEGRLTAQIPAKILTTYKRADDKLINGQYSFVTDTDYFDEYNEYDDYFEVIEEVWELTKTRTLKYGDLYRWCSICDEDVDLDEPKPDPIYCESCSELRSGALRRIALGFGIPFEDLPK